MHFKEHCRQSLELFGVNYAHVHRWLDAFAGTRVYGMRHRRARHNLAGIEEVRQKWGDQAAEVARQHIISDLKEEGWTEDDHFPRDEGDYVRMGLF